MFRSHKNFDRCRRCGTHPVLQFKPLSSSRMHKLTTILLLLRTPRGHPLEYNLECMCSPCWCLCSLFPSTCNRMVCVVIMCILSETQSRTVNLASAFEHDSESILQHDYSLVKTAIDNTRIVAFGDFGSRRCTRDELSPSSPHCQGSLAEGGL